MKKMFALLFFVLLSVAFMGQSAQDMTVRFIGKLNGNHYQRLDSVRFTNLTRGWSETIIYPDTTIVLNAIVNVNGNEFKAAGFEQNVPNPFDCNTSVEFSISQDENVKLQLFDAAGKQCAELNVALNAGSHKFEITASKPQAYILKAVAGAKTYSVRMINVGSCGGDRIWYEGNTDVLAKLVSEHEFSVGDNIEYVGFTTVNGEMLESRRFTQVLVISQEVILQFLSTLISTLPATEITRTSAIFNASITDNGGAEVTARGFYYGLDPENLDNEIVSNSTEDIFSEVVSLEMNTTYYYKAYAISSLGRAVGRVVEFTTENCSNTYYTDRYVICESDSFTWTDGITYTESTNTPTYVLPNSQGCDSIVTLNLIMACPPAVQTDSVADITTGGAKIYGTLVSDGGLNTTRCYFKYGANPNYLSNTTDASYGLGSFSYTLTNLIDGATYYYRACATSDAGTVYGDIMQFTTVAIPVLYSDPTGYKNGHAYVDLGLPSGIMWATCNVGTDIPTGYGNYYAWGETEPKDYYDWTTYRWSNGTYSNPLFSRYCNDANYGIDGFVDNLNTLLSSDDAATVNWGVGWRMPTYAEIEELMNNCTAVWVTEHGVTGRIFTGPNGNSIFLPAAGRHLQELFIHYGSEGYYWSSTLNPEYSPQPAWLLNFNAYDYGGNYFLNEYPRYNGFSVRPVCEP